MIHGMIRSVRTTIELPATVHRQVLADADHHNQSLASTLEYLSRADDVDGSPLDSIKTDSTSGFPYIDMHLGHVITSEDVARLMDEDS